MGSPVSTQLLLPSPYAFSLLSPPRPSNHRFLQYPIHHQIPTFNCNTPPKMTFTSTRVPQNRCFFSTNPNFGRSLIVKSHLKFNSPLISSDDHWGIWTSLFAIGAFGLWSEKTRIGRMVSAALVSILIGLAASNLRIIPYEAPVYNIVMGFLLPLTIPLLLFRADMRRVIQSTGRLLLAFLLGSDVFSFYNVTGLCPVATVIGTVVAYLIVPMRALGPDGWKIAAALMGSYIGGAVNYVAISEALGVSSPVMAAGVAADNVICAIYFMVLFALASRVPPETSELSNEVGIDPQSNSGNKFIVLPASAAIAVSFATCKSADYLTKLFGVQGAMLPIATAISVALATLFPTVFSFLAPFAEPMSLVLMQVFFAVIGASGSIWNVINTAPSIFLFALVQVTVHLAVILGLGKLFGFELKLLLLASNANIGGPTTACGMATAKGWNTLLVPGILAGIFGISIATFLGIGFGLAVLQHL